MGTWDKRRRLLPPMSEKKNFPNPLVFLGFPKPPGIFFVFVRGNVRSALGTGVKCVG